MAQSPLLSDIQSKAKGEVASFSFSAACSKIQVYYNNFVGLQHSYII